MEKEKELDVLERILDGREKPRNLRLSLLQNITESFSEERKIGQGGCGAVYKGTLRNKNVAVKKLFNTLTIADKQFHREVQSMTKVEHPNIVRFLGYCSNTEQKAMQHDGSFILADIRERLLCFEYIHNGSLENHLADELRGHEWHTRYQIIKGICEGLHHLHREKHIIHMDLKPANILLDDNLVPKITDFGLSRLDEVSHTMSAERFLSLGYCAPEYLNGGKMSIKSDIYSLGHIIIDLVTGIKDNWYNITNVLRKWKHRWNKSAKPSPLEYKQVIQCTELALRCINDDPNKRPNIWDIINALNETEKLRFDESSVEKTIASLDDMLGVQPLELHIPFEPNKEMKCSLKLTNDTTDYIAFSIQTMGPLQFSVQPDQDVVPPGSMCSVTITLQARENIPENRYCTNGFIVQSTRVDEGLTSMDINKDMFNETTGKTVDEVIVTVDFGATKSPEEPKHDLLVTPRVQSIEICLDNDGATKASGGPQLISVQKASVVTSSQVTVGPSELLVVHPLELHCPLELNKLVPCQMYLTNDTDEHVAFILMEMKTQSGSFLKLPLHGIVSPRSTCTLVVTSQKLEKPPERRNVGLTLKSIVMGDKRIHPFADQSECEQYFTDAKEIGKLVHEVTLKAVCGQQAEPTSELMPGTKILSVFNPCETLYSFDTIPKKKMIITGHLSGYIRLWKYDTQGPVGFVKVSKGAVYSVKFIVRNKWFVAGSNDGFITVYNYETKKNITRFQAHDSFISSLAVHPTLPYVLSSANGCPLKLWDWEKGWECTQTFEQEHSSIVCHVVFNPLDANSFASASEDHTIKVWNIASPYSSYTLSSEHSKGGHSKKVKCVDYFTSGDQQYLISGSNDKTAKIWDLQKMTCVQTLEGFLSPVTSVASHPNLPVLVTGSKDGTVLLWSATSFRLEKTFIFTCNGEVQGTQCLLGSTRVVIGQRNAVSVLSLDNMSYHEALASHNELPQTDEDSSLEDMAQTCLIPSKLLDVHPLKLHFPGELNKIIPCSVHLTNNTDEHVVFELTERTRTWSCFVKVPLQGIVPPRSTYTLIVTSKKLEKPPERREVHLNLQSSIVGDVHAFEPSKCGQFFTEAKAVGNDLVHEETLKAVYGQHGQEASLIQPGIKMLSLENTKGSMYSFDINPTKQWLITGGSSGYVRIRNFQTQRPVGSIKISKGSVAAVKFIVRNHWFVAGSSDGFINVYSYKTTKNITRFQAHNGFITSLAVHPTQPFILSSANGSPLKLWDWERGWECTLTYEKEHDSIVRHVTFNPLDTNSFASASDDHKIKIWNISSPYSNYTLDGHSDHVKCVDYFTSGDRQYLISGSDDQTAKIWDLQKRECIQTLETFVSPVTCVASHPNLPVIVTGATDGTVLLWNTSNFGLEGVLNLACSGKVVGIACLLGSRRVVIGHSDAVSLLSLENMNYQEALVASDELPCNEETSPGDMASEPNALVRKLLDVQPLQIHFPFELNKLIPCSLHLTNETDERVAFRVTAKGGQWGSFVTLPLCGVVLPRSTYTLVLTTKKMENPPKKGDENLILQSSVLGNQHIYPFEKESEYDNFFNELKEIGKVIHEAMIRADFGRQGGTGSEISTPANIKICSVDMPPQRLTSVDVNQSEPWILTGHPAGHVRTWNYDTQRPVDSFKDSKETVDSVKFIPRDQFFVAGSNDGFINVYDYKTIMQNIKSFKAQKGFITSLAVHPTKPYILSSANCSEMKLWDWEKGWECTETFEREHSSIVRQVVFDPVDTNSFATASDDHTVKVWTINPPYSLGTLEGHSDKVNCLDYFTCGDKQYLITGSDDQTAKIWDLQTRTCIETLDAFVTAVTAVCSHPSLPLLITGSVDGVVHFWSSTSFRLEKVLNFGFGDVVGIRCVQGSRRVVIAQESRFAVIELNDEETDAS